MPITATRLPVRSTSWFQRAEWNTSPWKSPMPSMSGSLGSDRPPAPTSSVRPETVRRSPVADRVSTTHRWASSSHAADSTVVSKTNRSRIPAPAATFWR